VLLLSPAIPEKFAPAVAMVAALVLCAALLCWKTIRWLRLAALSILVATGGLWASLSPSNDRDWGLDVARAPHVDIQGDEITIHNVRNFRYSSESDFQVQYETRKVNLRELSEVDILVSYWAGKEIAHIMVSFGFSSGQYLAVSIETRKEKNEVYSPVKGFFRNYELMYVVADERDLIGVRAKHRSPPERVYVLRTDTALENGRKLFLEYARKINELNEQPAFYNTLTTNCTTQVLAHVQAFGGVEKYNWKVLLSGYVPEYLFENGSLAPGMNFEELMAKALVTERAKEAPDDESFSTFIRREVPRPEIREESIYHVR